MYNDIFEKGITRLEEIYSLLLNEETDFGDEAELRVELIDLFSSINAAIINHKADNKKFAKNLEVVSDIILKWNPQEQLFRDQNELVELVSDILSEAKQIAFEDSSNKVLETKHLKNELDSLKSELSDLRLLMNELLLEKKSSKNLDMHNKGITEEMPNNKGPLIEEKEDIILDTYKTEDEIPLILPMENELETYNENLENYSLVNPEEEIIDDEEPFLANRLTQKLSSKQKEEFKPEKILDQMKSIITTAEKETIKQLESFKQHLKEEDKEQKAKTKIKSINQETDNKKTESQERKEITVDEDEAALIKPSRVIKQQQQIKSTISTIKDPYMQLLTLEAEKYRLEKEIEKNETNFQEGLKSKIEFDESILLINKELTIIRETIDSLRNQLIA